MAFAKPIILTFGDSLTASYGLPHEDHWVALLTKRLQATTNYQVVNASISGDTTKNGLARLPISLEQHKPDIIIMGLGSNDGLRGLSLELMKQNLEMMIDLSKQYTSEILLLGFKLPLNYGPTYRLQFENTFSDLAKEKNIHLVPFILESFATDLSYFLPDGIHPNKKAQPIILDAIWSHLSPLLKDTTKPNG